MITPLTRPIQAHGTDVTSIELKEPTGQQIIDIGFPYLILPGDGDEPAIEIRTKVIAKYIVVLGGIPPSSVGQLSGPDLSSLMGVVMGFFGVEAAV
ncbi:MAG TPA: phage tail assembly protein [Methylophilaceae bacterium]|nr:phage tail assembly protein [Methylophilaceae bacterium]